MPTDHSKSDAAAPTAESASESVEGTQPRPSAYAVINLGAAALAWTIPRAVDPLAAQLHRFLPDRSARAVSETILLGSTLALTYSVLEYLERTHPFRDDWQQPDRPLAEEAAYLLVISPIEGMVIERASKWLAKRLRATVGVRNDEWSRSTPLPMRMLTAALITDAGHYVHHRAAHQNQTLWRFHRRHHELGRLSWRNATIFHPLDMLPLMFTQEFPAQLAGVDSQASLSLRILKGMHGQLQHSNIASPLGSGRNNSGHNDSGRTQRRKHPVNRALGLVFSTSDQHRWHHALATRGRVNYAAMFSFFDRMFGSYHAPVEDDFLSEPVGTA